MKTGEKIMVVAGLGVLGWIIWRNWFRRGAVAVESVESIDDIQLPGLNIPVINTSKVGPPE